MKNYKIILFFLTTLLISCNNPSKQADETAVVDISEQENIDNSKYYATEDTVFIETQFGTLKHSKEEINQIVDNHPELFQEVPYNPDITFYGNVKYFPIGSGFTSETGQDVYYIFYAYFLKQRNGIEKYRQQRKQLIDIYRNINALFQNLRHGGTFFGHQYDRILAYAEYSLYQYPEIDVNEYDISIQKQLYIKMLRQIIEDDSKLFDENNEQTIEQRPKRNKIVDNLEKLITNYFYLEKAQQFHYTYY